MLDDYYRIRVGLDELKTQKDKGKLVRNITVEFNNMRTMKIVRNRDDLGDIEEKSLSEYLFDLWDDVTREGHERGKTFIDEL